MARLRLDVAQRRGYNSGRAELHLAWLVLLAVAIGGWNDRFKEVTEGALDGAKTAGPSDSVWGHQIITAAPGGRALP